MASQAPDLSQFDLNDPETRKWVQDNFKMDDPETKAHLEKLTTPKEDNGVTVPGTGAATFYPKEQPGLLQSIGNDFAEQYKAARGERVGLDNSTDFGPQFIKGTPIPNLAPARILGNVLDIGAAGGELLNAGLGTLFHQLGNEQSGSVGGVLEDLMNMTGGEAGMFHSPHGDPLAASSRAKLNAEADALFNDPKTTRADFDAWTDSHGMARFGDDLDEALKNRPKPQAEAAPEPEAKKATPIDLTNAKQGELGLDEQHTLPFERPTHGEAKLKQEADDFLANRKADPDLDFRQHDLPLEQPAQQLKMDLGEDTPVTEKSAAPEPTEHQKNLQGQVEELTKDWTNRPNYEVHQDFDGIEGVDPEANAAILKDGRVLINGSKITSPEKLKAVVFHESLGHHGMTQMFGDELDKTLTDFYDNSPNFRAEVDQWMKDNPNAYEGPDMVARAADEVLAERSEHGVMEPTLINKVKNSVKKVARKMGMKNLEYSDREIETILGMAHDAVRNGKGRDVASNGFRFSKGEARRDLIKAATERLDKTGRGETQTTQPFPEDEPTYWRFRHVTDDGREIGGFYNVEDGKLQDFNINSKAGPAAFGPRTVRKIAKDLLREHPEAKRISGYRISGARINGTGKSPFDAEFVESGARFSRDRKKTLSPEGMTTQNDVADLLDFTTKNIEDQKVTISDPEMHRMAHDLGLNVSKYLGQKGYTDQQLAARLLAAKQLFTNISDELAGLGEKLRNEGYSPSLHATIRQKLAQQEAIAAKLDNDTAEAGRALRVLREVTESKKSMQAQLRYMAENSGKDALADPATLQEFMDKYNSIGANSGVEAKVKFLRDTTKKSSIVNDVISLPRTIMSSMDLSAPLRQGVFLAGRKEFYQNFAQMFKYFGSEKAYKAMMEDIMSRPTYPLMVKSRLATSSADISTREEAFLSKFASNIPGVKHSERAYSGFLHKLRADVFDDLYKKSLDAGINLGEDPKALKDIANYVNTATGRGTLGGFEGAAPALANVFFSPRLIASRVNLLNPAYYMKLSPVVRKQAIKDLMSFGAIASTLVILAKMAGAEVQGDMRSSDFGKIKVGNTRYSLLGGFEQYLTLGARLATNKRMNAKGELVDLGTKYGQQNAYDVAGSFVRSKLAPVPASAINLRIGKDVVGNPVDLKSTVEGFGPMFAQDVMDVYNDQNGDITKTALKSAPGIFGVSMQTYDPNKPRIRGDKVSE